MNRKTFLELINDLRKTNKREIKRTILKRFETYGMLILKLTYDKNIIFGIRSLKSNKSGILDIEAVYSNFFDTLMKYVNKEIEHKEAIAKLTEVFSLCNKETQELINDILSRDLKCGISSIILNEVFGNNFIKEFKVQLANKYDPEKEYPTKMWLASPKLDGLRCFYVHNKLPHHPNWVKEKTLYTRNGKEIFGFEHIRNYLERVCTVNHLDFNDGELFSKDLLFEEIQSIVTTKKEISLERKNKIFFNLFAISAKNLEHFCETTNMLRAYASNEFFNVVEYYLVNSREEIERLHDRFVDAGYEGIMLRDTKELYNFERSNALLKYKKFKEDDFEIIDVEFGRPRTKYENEIVRLKVVKENIESWVGTGLTDSTRAKLKKLYKDKELFGKLVEIKYQNVTEDNSLRFPVYKKLKLDR